MENKRVSAVIIKDGKILLMRRNKNSREYYVFPGGSVELGEKFEEAMKREIKEELSLDAKIARLLFQVPHQDKDRDGIFFLIKEFSGTPELGSPEKERTNENNHYYPEWRKLEEIKNLENLYPAEAREKIEDLRIKKEI